MLGIIIGILMLVTVGLIAYHIYHDGVSVGVSLFIAAVVLMLVTPMLIIPLTGGLRGYDGNGEAIGYVTSVYEYGLVFKTGTIQMLAGDKGGLEKYEGSIADKELLKDAKSLIGKRVKVKFDKWAIAPFWLSDLGKGCVVVHIEEIE